MILVGGNEGGPFVRAATVKIEGNGGQREARKRYIQSDSDVAEQIKKGESVFVSAIPESSWKPTEVRIEVPKPRLIV